jgi:hypothetical protein
VPPPRATIEELAAIALDRAGVADAAMRVYATPGYGQGSVGIVVVSELPDDLEELRARGLRLISVEFRPSHLTGGVKSTSYALNMMAVDEAHASDADDAVFVDAGGTVLGHDLEHLVVCRPSGVPPAHRRHRHPGRRDARRRRGTRPASSRLRSWRRFAVADLAAAR